MMWARSSIRLMIGLERSGMAPSAIAKNTANTTIWRISFCAIASAIEVGTRWVKNFSTEKADTGRPDDWAMSGSVPGKFAPGCSRLTITRPSSSETKEALTNQPMVLAKMRPSLAPDPIWAMPPTSVANTSGAMIILIRRRNSVAIRLMSPASSTRLSGIQLKISVPITMPSAIAIRMYWVNLFDMSLSPQTPISSLADFASRATRLPSRALRQKPCCGMNTQQLAPFALHNRQDARFLRGACIKLRQTISGEETTMSDTNRQILLAEKPAGKLGPEHFKMVSGAVPEPGEGEALLRVRYISLDAANRAWMHGATYRSAVEAGSVMAGGSVAEVVSSKAANLAPGDLVFADTGWQDFAALPAKHLTRMPKIEPMTYLLSVYGVAGLTAYFGLLDIGKPREGETVVVSAAAGSVGSIVGQIAKIKGCRVVGIAGGPDKCRWLTSELGFDAAVDYKDGAVFKALKAAAPDGIDVYFDNVGGDIFEACLPQMNNYG